jgi:vitamin B12/bleomycin/antimicrobial peptide transport system ATP-binding/permease protein
MGLGTVVEKAGGLDSERDWPVTFSLKEQQLLALTRLVLARAAFAMLDRVNAVLDAARFSQVLRHLDENSISYVALAEDIELVQQYDAVLEIGGDGSWSWRPTDRGASPASGRPRHRVAQHRKRNGRRKDRK